MGVGDAEKVFGEDNSINETVHDALDANEVFQHAPGGTPPDFYAPLAILDDISGGYGVT
jgi:hypothetical protein